MNNKIDLSTLDPLYDKKYTCFFCQTNFSSKKLRSRFVKPKRMDSDFAPIFDQENQNNPLLYYVIVCPSCGIAFTDDFNKTIGNLAKQRVKQQIYDKRDKSLNFCGDRDFAKAIHTYKLGIYTAQVLREKHIVFANLCLRLAWLYRGVENKEEEMRFLKLALGEFEQSYIHTDFNTDTTPEMQVLYLIGELNRRIGNFNDSIRYFATVIEHPDKSRYMKYVTLSRDQWRLGVEEYKESKRQTGGDVS